MFFLKDIFGGFLRLYDRMVTDARGGERGGHEPDSNPGLLRQGLSL